MALNSGWNLLKCTFCFKHLIFLLTCNLYAFNTLWNLVFWKSKINQVPRSCLKFKAKLCFEIAITMCMYQSTAALTCLRLPVNCHAAIRYPVGKPVVKGPQSRGALRTLLSLAGCTQVGVPGPLATPEYQHGAELGRKYRQSHTQSSCQNRSLVGLLLFFKKDFLF